MNVKNANNLLLLLRLFHQNIYYGTCRNEYRSELFRSA